MATVDNSTQIIISTESGTGWSVDVTNANLDPLLTLKDFIVRFDNVVQNNADFTKTSQTIITYNGVALGSTTTVTIQRDTPNDRVKCLTFGDRLQSAEYEAEFNRVHKLINENELTNNVRVTLADTTPGTLEEKTDAGADIALTVLNPGANEQLRVSYTGNAVGDPHVDINSTGTSASAVGADAIAIGVDVVADGTNSIVVGNSSVTDDADFTTDDCIVIGTGASINPTPTTGADSSDSIAIGTGATVTDAPDAVAIGNGASVTGANAVAISCDASVSGNEAVAIGFNTSSDGNSSVAIGSGANSGTGTNNICIGRNTSSNSANAIAIGNGSIANANNAIQLGVGGNGLASSLQFLNQRIANDVSIQAAYQTTGIAPTTTPENGTLVLDHNGGTTTLYARANGSWIVLAGVLVNQDITSGIDITVTPGTSNDRLFITPTANINLILLTAGAANTTHFTFVNLDPGSFNIDIKIDLVGNPTILTLGGGLTNINVGYTGTDYRFYG